MSRCKPLHRLFHQLATVLILLLAMGCSDEGANAGENAGENAGQSASQKAPGDPAMKAIDAFIRENKVDTQSKTWKQHLRKPPLATFDPAKSYIWKLTTTEGEIRIKLMPEVAPMHVTSTLYLTRLGFYDGLGFHRVVKNFMAQGGDPAGNGSGGPGYSYGGEFDKTIRHDVAGTLSMANTGRPMSDGSQFFITFGPTPGLDDKHTIFGRAESGTSMETIRKIEALGKERDPAPPLRPVLIERATIVIE